MLDNQKKATVKPIGRSKELDQLKCAFAKVEQGMFSIVLVEGEAGVGKTRLIKSFKPFVLEKSGHFFSGKFYKNGKQKPYAAIEEIIQEYVSRILTDCNEKEVQQIGNKVEKKLGADLKLLTEFFPELSKLFNLLPEPERLNINEFHYKIQHLLIDLFSCLFEDAKVVTLFIDDIQWIDNASLALLERLAQIRPIENLLLILARRNNSCENDSVNIGLNKISYFIPISTLKINNLELDNVKSLLIECLQIHTSDLSKLALVVHSITKGNPFFIFQYLNHLCNQNVFTRKNGDKLYSINWLEINSLPPNLSLTDIVLKRLNSLTAVESQTLQFCSVFDIGFTPLEISIALDKEQSEVREELENLRVSNFLVYHECNEQFFFAHDVIHHASSLLFQKQYSERLPNTLSKIGFRLAQCLHPNELEKKLFQITTLLNKNDTDSLTSQKRETIILMNVRAGELALKGNSNELAKDYFSIAFNLIEQSSSRKPFELRIIKGLIQAYLGLGKISEAKIVSDRFLKNSQSFSEKLLIYCTLLEQYERLGLYEENIAILYRALAVFNVEAPDYRNSNAIRMAANREIVTFINLFKDKSAKQLLSLKPTKSIEVEELIKVLMYSVSSAHFLNVKLFVWVTMKMMNIVLSEGTVKGVHFIYACQGVILAGLLGDFKMGYDLGKLSIEILNNSSTNFLRSRTYCAFSAFLNFIENPLNLNFEGFETTLKTGIETGEYAFMAFAYHGLLRDRLVVGHSLEETEKLCNEGIEFMDRINNSGMLASMKLFKGVILGLQGRLRQIDKLNFDNSSEIENVNLLKRLNFKTALVHHYIFKSYLLVIGSMYSEALKLLEECEEHLIFGGSQSHIVKFYLLRCICIARLRSTSENHITTFENDLANLKKWAEASPVNFQTDYYLGLALYEGFNGNLNSSKKYFLDSIEAAQNSGFNNMSALCYEQYSLFYNHRLDFSIKMRQHANDYFKKWGVDIEVLNRIDTWQKQDLNYLDYNSIFRANRVLSSENDYNLAIEELLNIILNTARASKGVLFIKKELSLFAEIHVENANGLECQKISTPALEFEHASYSLVYSTYLNKEVNIIESGSSSNNKYDEYLSRDEVKLLCCIPIMISDKIEGLLYLESNNPNDDYTQSGLDTLKLLSTEIGIILENWRLYNELKLTNENLELKIQERTQELERSTKEIVKKNEVLANHIAIQSKLQGLSAQMNPHFIFNSLNAVQYFILSKASEKALLFVSDFSSLMRMALENSLKTAISLAQELQFLHQYLTLEKQRYDELFEYKIEISNNIDINNFYIPPMLIQPYVENAIIHGLGSKKGKGKLDIHFRLSDSGKIICEIKDNGVGRKVATEMVKLRKGKMHKSRAMGITETRLKLLNSLYYDQFSSEIIDLTDDNQAPIGTLVKITMPDDLLN